MHSDCRPQDGDCIGRQDRESELSQAPKVASPLNVSRARRLALLQQQQQQQQQQGQQLICARPPRSA